MVDNWTEVEIKIDVTGEIRLKDIPVGEHLMEEKDEEKYQSEQEQLKGRDY